MQMAVIALRAYRLIPCAWLAVAAWLFIAPPNVTAQDYNEKACPEAPGYSSRALLGAQGGSMAGSANYRLGDINGDGREDYAIVAPAGYLNGRPSGLIYVVYGNPWQQEMPLSRIWPDETLGARAGFVIGTNNGELVYRYGGAIAAVGDLDGDGYDDFVLGDRSYFSSSGIFQRGAVYVFYGGPARNGEPAFPQAIDLTKVASGIYGDRVREYFGDDGDLWTYGEQVVALGDINGDGYHDFAASITLGSGENLLYGPRVYYGQPGRPQVLSHAMQIIRRWANGGYPLGRGLASGFDFDADGVDDLMVCAPTDNNETTIEGTCYLLWGATLPSLGPEFNVDNLMPENGGDGSLGLAFTGGDEAALLGLDSRFSGNIDLNGDGFDDLVFGSPHVDAPDGTESGGRVYVVYGGPQRNFVHLRLADMATATPGPDQLGFVLEPDIPPRPPVYFGEQVAPAGDVNGDGIGDLLIGASAHYRESEYPWYPCGAVWGIHGRTQAEGGFPPLIRVTDDAIANGLGWKMAPGLECVNQRFGHGIVSLPDFTGDGKPEWLIGANAARFDGFMPGKTCLYLSSQLPFPLIPGTARNVDVGSRGLWLILGTLVLIGGVLMVRRQ